jgi:hypothetical protein
MSSSILRTVALIFLLVVSGEAFSVNPLASIKPSTTALGPTARNGLTYEDVEIGTGRRVNKGDTILCYYEGSYETGGPLLSKKSVTFDATAAGEPVEFLVGKGQLITGMDIGICGDLSLEIPPMNIGGDRRLKIPSELAYGEQGAGGSGGIPPNQDLMFQIDILNAQTTKGGSISDETKLLAYAGTAIAAVGVAGIGIFVINNL